MKFRILALTLMSALIFVGSVSAQKTARRMAPAAKPLVQMLPPSEVVLTLDAKRFFGEAMPQILSANQPMLNDIIGKFDEIKKTTGIDFRQFDEVAVGTTAIVVTEKSYDFEPLVLARGKFKSTELIAVAKTISNGKYREEKIGERSIFVFSPGELIESNKDKVGGGVISGVVGKAMAGLTKEMALTTYDNQTIVLGTVARVREMFESKTRISSDVLSLVSRKPGSVLSFGAKVPNGLDGFIELDSDELGNNLRSIRELAGSMNMSTGRATLWIAAKTAEPAQAQSLKAMLDGLKGVFGPILKSSKNDDSKMYGRLLESARLSQAGNEVALDVVVPQTDIDKLLGAKK